MRHHYVHLHEIAHTWYGDLTTMHWWNDLWLKESFADFCAASCLIECIHKLDPAFSSCKDMWTSFLSSALAADLAPSTHPICLPIKHTGDAVSAFDEISYRKGASWIKTLDNFLGREILQKGLALYVKRFSYSNSTLDDFVMCLKEAHDECEPSSTLDLKAWTNSWLKTKGPNAIIAKVDDQGQLNVH